MGRTRYLPPAPEVIERERRVLELRRDGHSYDSIGKTLAAEKAEATGLPAEKPLDRSNIQKIYKRALGRTLAEPAHEIRQMESIRLDAMQIKVYEKALNGDTDAIKAVLLIMGRRARLLGLDHADGIAERALEVEAGKLRLLAVAVGRMFDELDMDAEQRMRGTRVLFAELRAHVDDPDEIPELEGPGDTTPEG